MSRTKIVLACVFLCSALVMTAAAGNVPVTTTIQDFNPAIQPFSIQSDSADGGNMVYQDSNTLISNIMTKPGLYGMYVLWTEAREIGITFDISTCSNGPCTSPFSPLVTDYIGVTLKAQSNLSYQYGVPNTDMLSMKTGDSILCPLFVMFDYNGGSYQIHMGKVGGEVVAQVNDNGTDPAKITCPIPVGGMAGSVCNNWNIEPYPGSYSVGRLWKAQQLTKRTISWVSMGDFKFSFSMNLHR